MFTLYRKVFRGGTNFHTESNLANLESYYILRQHLL